MSDYQKLLKAIAAEAWDTPVTLVNKLNTLVAACDGLSEYYHKDAIFAAFEIKEEKDA